MPYHTPEAKTEEGLKRYLEGELAEAELAGVQVVKRFSGDDLTPPMLSILASNCEPMIPEDFQHLAGNYKVDVVLTLASHYKDQTADQHDAFVGAVADALYHNDLQTTLTALMEGEECTFQSITPGARKNTVDGHQQLTEINLTVYMYPSA